MKKLRKLMLKSIISFVLAIALVMGAVPLPNMGGLLPNLVIKANAAEYTANPTTKDELVPSASSGSVSEAHVVKYANKEWYVIGYDGVGLASESGTMTLFLKGTLGSREFSDNYSNVYANSSIHSYLGSYLADTANFTSNESAAVVARTLSGGGSTGNSNSSHVSGDSVNANLWRLSAAEARKLPQNIIKSGGDGYGWWLRSPGNLGCANYMPVSPGGMNDVPKESGAGVGSYKSVRAAMLIDLNSVIYSSETNTLIAQEAEAHNITVSVNNDQGSVDAPSRADKGETVKFTITPEVGYAVDTVKFNDTSLSPVNGVYSFTMPNVDVTISVTFNQIYKVEDHIEQDGDTYTIKTAKGWEVFCDCVKSDTYNGFGGKTVKLGLDITDGVTVSAGILGKPFYGTFDGGGHTLAVALNSTDEWVAPFSVLSGSIKNLTVTGTVKGSNYAGGLTGLALGGSIENVTVNADISGSSKIGGITGYCNFGSLLVKNTVFNGSLQCDGDVCGLIGWASENVGYNQAITIKNCLFNGSYICGGEFHPITVRNSNSNFEYTDYGAYYTVVPKLSSENYIICAGTHVSTITVNSKFEITTEPTFSFDSVNYYAEGTSISLKGSGSIESVVINNGAVEVTDNKNGTYSFTMPDCNVTVEDKLTQMISFESATQTKTYGDEDFTVTATHSVGDGEVSYAVTEGTDVAEVNSSTGAVTIKKAGTAIITATAAAKNNFAEATAQYTLTVEPKSITLPEAATGLKWTGNEQTGVADGEGYTVTDGKKTDAGNYTATAVLTDKTNTKWSSGSTDDQSIAWSIDKADGPAAPTGLSATSPTTNEGSDGTISGVDSSMEYADNSGFSSVTACTGTEITGLSAGAYYVRVRETETHEAGAYASVTVPEYNDNSAKVKQAPIPKTNLVYSGMAQDLVEAGEAENGTMYYAVTTTNTAPKDDLYSTSIPAKIEAGTYYIWYKAKGDDNHADSDSTCVTVTIETVKVTITAKNQSILVGGTVPTLSGTDFYTVTGLVGEDTLTTAPTLAYQKSGSAATPDNTKAGTYDIVPSGAAVGDNYTISYTNGTLTINEKGTQTITASDVTATYGDTDKKVSATVTDPATGGGAISYAVKDGSADSIAVDATTGALTIKAVPTDGKAYVTVTAAKTDTYAQTTKDVTVTISRASATAAIVTANNRTYDGTEKPLVTVDASTLSGGTMSYAVTTENKAPTVDQLYTTSIPAATNAGTYYVWYKVEGDENHNGTEAKKVNVSIAKAASNTVSVDITGWTYGDKANSPVTTGFGSDKAVYTYSDTEIGNYTDKVPSTVGKWYVKASVADTDNYSEGVAVKSFEITKRKLTITADSDSKTYDGTALTKDSYIISENGLAKDDVISKVTVKGTQTEVGSSDNVPSAAVIKKGDSDVTENYDISYVNGKLSVTKATPIYTKPTDKEITCRQTLENIELPANFSFANPKQVLAIGENTVKVTFTPTDTDNYNAVENITIKVTVNNHVLNKTKAVEATCEKAGNSEYWTCSECGKHFSDAEGKTEITEGLWVIGAKGHTFDKEVVDAKYLKSAADCTHKAVYYKSCECGEKGTETFEYGEVPGHNYGEPTYTWSEDGKACTATAVCANDAKHVLTEEATVTSEVTTPSTCKDMGKTTYTAAFTNEVFTTQTKEVTDVAKQTTHTPKAAVKEKEVAATCEADGSYEEVICCSVCGEELSRETKTVKAAGHDYGTPEYKWSEDGKTCTATVICKREGCTDSSEGHKVTENAVVTSKVKETATTEKMGTTTYTATFKNELFTTQTKDVEDIPKLDKPSDNPSDNPSDKPADKPSDNPVDNPSDKPADKPQDTTTPVETTTTPAVKEEGTTLSVAETKAEVVVTSKAGEEPTVTYKGTTDTAAKEVTVPDSVTVDGVTYKVTLIAKEAFKGNKTLEKATVGENIETVGDKAFAGCTNLKTIVIKESVKEIGNSAFEGCSKLSTITLGKNVEKVGNKAFANCKSLTKIIIPKSTKKIGNYAFKGNKKLKTIIVKTTKLTKKTVAKRAFSGVGNKVTIKVPKSKKKVYKKLFRKRGLSKKVKVI